MQLSSWSGRWPLIALAVDEQCGRLIEGSIPRKSVGGDGEDKAP